MSQQFKALIIDDPESPSAKQNHARRSAEAEGLAYSYSYPVRGHQLKILPWFRYQYDVPASNFTIGFHGVGLALAHMSAWNVVAQTTDYTPTLILEADAVLAPGFVDKAHKALEDATRLEPEWDWLFLGSCGGVNTTERGYGEVIETRYPMCNHGYVITPRAARQLLSRMEKLYAPLDILLLLHYFDELRVLTRKPDIVWQCGTIF